MRKVIMPNDKEKLIHELTKKLTDEGRIIEAGFTGFKFMTISAIAPPVQVEEMRNAFFAGAQHLFSSIMSVLDIGEEPTENDLNRLTLINEELKNFINNFELKNLPAKGNG